MAITNERSLEIVLEVLAETEASIVELRGQRNRADRQIARDTAARDEVVAARTANATARETALSAALAADELTDATRDELVEALRTNAKDTLTATETVIADVTRNRDTKDGALTAMLERRRVMRRVLDFLARRLN